MTDVNFLQSISKCVGGYMSVESMKHHVLKRKHGQVYLQCMTSVSVEILVTIKQKCLLASKISLEPSF